MFKFFQMKIFSNLLIILMFFLMGCSGNNDSKTAPPTPETAVDQAETDSLENDQTIVNIPSLWSVEVQADNSEKLQQPEDQHVTFTPEGLISALNESYPEVHLNLQKISHDTAFISIPQSTYLTDEAGSTGAYNYMAMAVYNITELKNVKYVKFTFNAGDHAAPGTFSRDDFKRLR